MRRRTRLPNSILNTDVSGSNELTSRWLRCQAAMAEAAAAKAKSSSTLATSDGGKSQLVRGSSALGSPPFPTKEAPAHKKSRKRRLVVDHRRVNARVRRSTYYCRKATDVLATAAGSVWYSFVDAVTRFNQIANTRRAVEILAVVARSGKFLPVCLTFGPVNGPDDFCFL